MSSRVLVSRASRPGGDGLAVLEDGDAVADLADLLEPVRDVDDGDAVGREVADHPEEVLRPLLTEHRRRLVHDDAARASRDSARAMLTICWLGGGQGADLARRARCRRDRAASSVLAASTAGVARCETPSGASS